jgi:hypothetical protein
LFERRTLGGLSYTPNAIGSVERRKAVVATELLGTRAALDVTFDLYRGITIERHQTVNAGDYHLPHACWHP